ncbi:hypothetical protein [uncultured Acinetobacter sp.]|uniref:hypothetical protein n=1 Tax=uncultured Acinetobacter sp. TaxID=165433 RepID=UPI0025830636|nr:hypothetical protein [uncultured Acinetobacter sp.]
MKNNLNKSIDRRVMTVKIKETRSFSNSQQSQKSFQEMQETLKIIADLKSKGVLANPQFNVALHGEIR